MKVAIDAVGRMVVPKSLRDELGITGPTTLEVRSGDGCLEVSVPDLDVRVEERDGHVVLVCDEPTAPMTAEDVRAVLDATRR